MIALRRSDDRGQALVEFALTGLIFFALVFAIIAFVSVLSLRFGIPQMKDLAANARQCTVAYWHYPRFSSYSTYVRAEIKPLWDALWALQHPDSGRTRMILKENDVRYVVLGKRHPDIHWRSFKGRTALYRMVFENEVVAIFEPTIDKLAAVAIFMPVVAGMGGNAGTQTLTVIVRGIALGELTWSNSRKALVKEAAVGLANGIVLGLVAAAVAWATRGNPVLGLVLCAAMVINMFVAATAGTLVPLGLRAVNVDPALASSVFITTLTDVFGFFSFLGLATVFMRYLAPGG